MFVRERIGLDQPVDHLRQLLTGYAELPGRAGEDQAEDLAALRERLESTTEAADEALAGELPTERSDEVAETLGICERILRRRQILRPS